MSNPTHQNNLEIKRREDNINFLQTQITCLSRDITNLQVSHAKHHSGNGNVKTNANEAEEEEQILQHDKSAASLLYKLQPFKSPNASQALSLTLTKDVLGIIGVVATLGRVEDDNLSRLLSEYLGLETMLSIVCRTSEAVKVLEKYDDDGTIISISGIHGLGSCTGNSIEGRFQVICLEEQRPYVGGYIADDPQKKLALPKPKLQNGESPHGFLDYAVNMINLDKSNLLSFTIGGHGLRDTLFYSLFSRLQVYKTRAEMLLALPCINDGAISLDGGMIKQYGVFSLGNRKDIGVKFLATPAESSVPADYYESEEKLKKLKLDRNIISEDKLREQEKLDLAKTNSSAIL